MIAPPFTSSLLSKVVLVAGLFCYSNSSYFCFVSIFKQALAFRRFYFKDYWNLLDLFIVVLSVIDIVIDQAVTDRATGSFSPSILKVAKVFRVLRMGRLLRLFKVSDADRNDYNVFFLSFHLHFLCLSEIALLDY